MKHFTFKQVDVSVFNNGTSNFSRSLITPPSCGKGEFITIGNRNALTVVFIKSEQLPNDIDFGALFDLPRFDIDTQLGVIQYNSALGGYLYSWANDSLL